MKGFFTDHSNFSGIPDRFQVIEKADGFYCRRLTYEGREVAKADLEWNPENFYLRAYGPPTEIVD